MDLLSVTNAVQHHQASTKNIPNVSKAMATKSSHSGSIKPSASEDLDSAFLKEGLGFFDRSARVNATNGWSGNYILSQFNEWGIPVVCPTWSLSRVAMAFAEEPRSATSVAST